MRVRDRMVRADLAGLDICEIPESATPSGNSQFVKIPNACNHTDLTSIPETAPTGGYISHQLRMVPQYLIFDPPAQLETHRFFGGSKNVEIYASL